MMTKVSINFKENFDLSHTRTILPRLGYSIQLLDSIQNQLKTMKTEITKQNKNLDLNIDEKRLYNLKLEKKLFFAITSLNKIQKRLESISVINNIPSTLPSIIPAVRTISAQLFEIMPECSQKLCELSIYLGSIAIDSATITEAKFDFRQTNLESNVILDEAKLIVDSKISKQYPNVDLFKAQHT